MGIQKKGYMGKIMQVNLSSGQVSIQKIPDRVYESFLSGMGLAAFFLYHKIPENTDPLGPDNVLGFVSGLLNGTGALFSGRWMAVGKSPLTGGWGEANCGGYFAPAIKRCGVDAIFFSGISPKPVYLYVDDKGARIRSAEQIWGMDAVETEEFLLDHHSRKNARVACIGPAGERLSLISGISTDKGRMAARSGLGAIMGSKGLKALVLAGTARIRAHNRDEIKRISRICNKWVQFQPPFVPGFLTAPVGTLMRALPFVLTQDGLLYKIMLRKWGTVSMNQISVEMGDAPIKNWKGTSRDWGLLKSLSSNPGTFTKRETRKYHCHSCPLGCGGICENHSQATHKPEYETVLCFGGLVMNQDMDLVFQINEKLNRAGMDSISAGHCVAFAMECFEAGILTTQDTQGVELGWGDPLAISFLVDAMIKREGIGDILADGVKAASQKIGKRSHEMAVHAGGQEPGMHDSRNDPGFALHYSADPAPGRHTNGAGLYYEMYQLWKVVKGLPRPGLVYMKKIQQYQNRCGL